MSDQKENLFKPVGEAVEELKGDQGNQEHAQQVEVKTTDAADAMGHPVQEIESLCMNCHADGTTRLLLTSIPFFREVIIMSFHCPECGFQNSEIQPASQIQEKGAKYMLKVENQSDFNRQVIKSETASCRFVELDIEIPAKRGQLTTVEGLLSEMIEDLESDQAARKLVDENLHDKIQEVIERIRSYIDCKPGTLPLTFILDDPAGNSWIEYRPGEPSHKWSHTDYFRTDEQNLLVGIISRDDLELRRQKQLEQLSNRQRNPSEATKVGSIARATELLSDSTEIENFTTEVQTFRASCPSCTHECETHMKPVDIPHFKEVIIMSTVCDKCGYKSNEVKTGGAIPEKGRKTILYCDDPTDLNRDILKSETCTLSIPELHVEIQQGTLGGRFTTLEGLLQQVYEELENRVYSQTSDSMDDATKHRWQDFFATMKEALQGKSKFTVIMEDPLAGSYIQNVYAPDKDPNMTIVDYERTEQQNEDLGLNDIKVDQ